MLYVNVAERVVNECLHLAATERVSIVTDESPGHPLVHCVAAAARVRCADVTIIGIERVPAEPHGYLSWRDPGPVVAAALAASQVTVFYMSTLCVLSETIRVAAAGGTRMLFIPAGFDLRRPVVLNEDLIGLDALGSAVIRRLSAARTLHLTTDEGTDLVLDAAGRVTYDDCQVRDPGDIDFFPGGMWNLVPTNLRSVTGVVRFVAALHPVGRLTDPVEITFHDGTVTDIQGGWQARIWERWLHSFGRADATRFAHLSGGLARYAQVIGHDWEDLIVRGSVLVSGGASLLYGGDIDDPAHFDGIVPNATLKADGETILDHGDYRLPETNTSSEANEMEAI